MYLNNTLTEEQFIDLTHFVIEGDETECCVVEIVNTEQPFLDQEQPMTLLYQQLPESRPAIVVQQPLIVEPKDVTEQVLGVNDDLIDEKINNNEDSIEEEVEEKLVIVEQNINNLNEDSNNCIVTTVGETVSSIVDAVDEINNAIILDSGQNSIVSKKPARQPIVENQVSKNTCLT
jgi:hypothetical protein